MPIPVLPAVPSTTTPPGRKAPRATASLIIANATRSLTEPPGFMNSALPRIVHPVASEAARSLMRGVRPIAATTSRAGFIEVLCIESVKGRRRRVLRQASALAMKRRDLGERALSVFLRLENILDDRIADQPLAVRRAHRRLAVLWPTRPPGARTGAGSDPRFGSGGDLAGRQIADRAAGGPLPVTPAGSAFSGGHYRARGGHRQRRERSPRGDRVR